MPSVAESPRGGKIARFRGRISNIPMPARRGSLGRILITQAENVFNVISLPRDALSPSLSLAFSVLLQSSAIEVGPGGSLRSSSSRGETRPRAVCVNVYRRLLIRRGLRVVSNVVRICARASYVRACVCACLWVRARAHGYLRRA